MKRILLTISGIIVVLLILTAVALLSGLKKPENIIPPTPTGDVNIPENNTDNKRVKYDPTGSQKLLKTMQDRPPLSASDAEIRKEIIGAAGNSSAVLEETQLYALKYIKAPNIFEVRIKTANIDAAKQDAVRWFSDRGMSNSGICNLPLLFFPDASIQQELNAQNIKFSPIANICNQ